MKETQISVTRENRNGYFSLRVETGGRHLLETPHPSETTMTHHHHSTNVWGVLIFTPIEVTVFPRDK